MRIYDFMIQEMTKRCMSLQDAESIMKEIVSDRDFAFGTMADRWSEPADAYPRQGLQMMWTSVSEKALVFIETHYPQAFFKPLFFDHQALEQYKKDNNYEGWLAKRKEKAIQQEEETIRESGCLLNIINDLESYSAEFIKKWCQHQMNNRTKHAFEAGEIFDKYWGIDADLAYAPNPKVFYFVSYERNNIGFKEAKLHRDEAKSPRKKRA